MFDRKNRDGMKRKGFTLVELLAVIVILAIIALVSTPIILTILSNVRKSAFKSSAYGILESGNLYYASMVLSGNVEEKTFLFDGKTSTLEYSGEIPKGGILQLSTNGEVMLAIHNNEWCALKGKTDKDVHLIKYEEGNCIIPDNAKDPMITLNGKNYIRLKQGQTYKELGAIAKTLDGGSLSYQTTITFEGETVEVIDSSVLGNRYFVTYQAENNGKTVTVNRTVVIVDSVGPTITFDPEIVTLKLNELSTYDFYEGVTVTDEFDGVIEVNSNTVKVLGTLEPKVGTYELTYEATDEEGNLGTAKRTFIIEAAEGPILNFSSLSTNNSWLAETTLTITATDIYNLTSFSYELLRDGVSLGVNEITVTGKSSTEEIQLTETGIYKIVLIGKNEMEGVTRAESGEYKIDSSTPTLTASVGYNIYPVESYTLSRYAQSGNTFTATGHDPQMNFTNIGKYQNITQAVIHFEEPLQTELGIQMFYNAPYTESDSARYLGVVGTKTVPLNLPKKTYSSLRFDIGSDTNDTFKLSRIEVVTSTPITTRNDVSLYITGSARSGIDSYSFDGGVTWQKENFKYFTANGDVKLMVKSNTGFISEVVPYSVTSINKNLNAASLSITGATLSDVTRSGNTFKTTTNDPKMTYSNTSSYKKIRKARIYFEEPVEKSMYIQIFYYPFSEANSVVGNIKAGETFIELDMPSGTYSQLRFDIGNEPGLTYKLANIELFYEG